MTPEEERLLKALHEVEGLATSAVEAEHIRWIERDVEEFLKKSHPECEFCHRELMRGKPYYDYYCAYCQLGFDLADVEDRKGRLIHKLVPNVYKLVPNVY